MAAAQLPLNLPHVAGSDRADLVESTANRAAIDLIDAWPGWPSPVAVLVGPRGSGKSHMGRVWARLSEADIVPAREASGLDHGEPVSRNFLIEDVRPGMVPERALFHLLNHVRSEHGHCLLTSRSRPSAWAVALPDLASRLRAAAVVEIGLPDDELLSRVLFKLLSDRQIVVDPAILAHSVARMPRSLGAASRLADLIDAESLSRGQPVTRAVVNAALARISAVSPDGGLP
jgi:chromosomal replication initiation ATPase DnaA